MNYDNIKIRLFCNNDDLFKILIKLLGKSNYRKKL